MGALETNVPYVYITDVVSAYKVAVQQLLFGRIKGHSKYSVFSGHFVSLESLISILIEISGVDIPVISDDKLRRKREISYADNFLNLEGWGQKVGIKEGLREILISKGCLSEDDT